MCSKRMIKFWLILSLIFMPSCIKADDVKSESAGTEVKGKFIFVGYRNADRPKNPWGFYCWENSTVKRIGHFGSGKWSNNGKKIITKNETGLVIIDKKGNVLQTFKNIQNVAMMSWSPDNKRIVYSSDNGTKKIDKIYLYDLKNETNELLIDFKDKYRVGNISFSPDGMKFIFQQIDVNDITIGGIFLYDLETRTSKLISKQGNYPTWSHDDQHIIVKTNRNEDWSMINKKLGVLMKINVETGEKTILRELTSMIKDIGVSKDGKYIYYSKPVRYGGYIIAISPIDQPDVEIPVTKPVPVKNPRDYSQDLYPDWYQGE